MYSIPRASRASATYRSRSPWVTEESPRHFLTDPVGAPLGVRAGEERGQPVPRQFPCLVRDPEPFHPRLGAERLRHHRVQKLDAPEIEERARVLAPGCVRRRVHWNTWSARRRSECGIANPIARSSSSPARWWCSCQAHTAATRQLVSGRNPAIAPQALVPRSRRSVLRVPSTASEVNAPTSVSGTATRSRFLRTSFTGKG